MSCETEGPVHYADLPVAQGATGEISGYLTDEDGDDLALADVQSLTLTLTRHPHAVPTNVIGTRNALDILNTAGGTLAEVTTDEDGQPFPNGATRLRFTFLLTAGDNGIAVTTDTREEHKAVVTWGYDSTHVGKAAFVYSVQRL